MSKKIQLSIPTPCHENWDNMSPVEKGKFCGSCQKQVVDFTNMSDREVAQFFKKPSTGSVCGRFMPDQLDRDIEIPKKRIPWLKYFFQIALPALLFSKLSAQKTIGKVATPLQRDTTKISVQDEMRTLGMVLPTCIKPAEEKPVITALKGDTTAIIFEDKRVINGKVTDEAGLPIPGASIFIKGTHTGTVADNNGTFKIMGSTGDVLFVSSVGLETTELRIGIGVNIDIELKRQIALGGEVLVTVGLISTRRSVDYKQLIRGKVVDEGGDAIPYATIETGKEKAIMNADGNGYFSLPLRSLTKDSTIDISSPGFEREKINIEKEDAGGSELYITLKKIIAENKLIMFPNPVRAGSGLNISFKEPQEGDYTLQLLNQSGQLVHQKEIRMEKEVKNFPFALPGIAAGSYFIVLTSKETGKKITGKLMIQ